MLVVERCSDPTGMGEAVGGTGEWGAGLEVWAELPLLSAASPCRGRGLSPCVMAKHTGSELRREESCSSKARYWHKHKRISTGRD